MNRYVTQLISVLSLSFIVSVVTVSTSIAGPITLTTDSGSNFGGLYLDGAGAKVGVIFLHGRGGNPDSAVVRELRASLNNQGYSTLSIEDALPSTNYCAAATLTDWCNYTADISSGDNYVFPETYDRVNASIEYLAATGVEQIVLAGFSLGSRLALAAAARGLDAGGLPVVGYIGLGMRTNGPGPLNALNVLDELTIPMLDIYGDNDYDAVVGADARQAVYGGNPADYTRVVLDCADDIVGDDCHKFRGGLKGGDDMPLEMAVYDWISAVAPLTKVPEPGSLALFGAGLIGFSMTRQRRKSAARVC